MFYRGLLHSDFMSSDYVEIIIHSTCIQVCDILSWVEMVNVWIIYGNLNIICLLHIIYNKINCSNSKTVFVWHSSV
jgi:hypothetical protein